MNYRTITLKKENISNFAESRNELLREADENWILFLDTDEVLSGKITSITEEFSAYEILRKNYFLNKYVGSEYIVRLAKKNTGKWIRRVHEIWEIDGKIGRIDNPYIIHNTGVSLSSYIKKMNFYSTLHASANKEEGKTSSLFKIIFFPKFKFILTFIKSRHLVFSLMQSFHSFLSWSKLYFLRS